jgi:hypothetical protein
MRAASYKQAFPICKKGGKGTSSQFRNSDAGRTPPLNEKLTDWDLVRKNDACQRRLAGRLKMLAVLFATGVLALAAQAAPPPSANASLDLAVRHAVLDFCVPRMVSPAEDEDKLAKQAGIELLKPTPGAGPFADAKSMRGLFALHPTGGSMAMVDGLSATGSAQGSCLVRIVDAEGGASTFATFLRTVPGWSAAGEETRGAVHMVTFRKTVANQPYDVGIDVADDTSTARRPDGMRGMISVRPLRKTP